MSIFNELKQRAKEAEDDIDREDIEMDINYYQEIGDITMQEKMSLKILLSATINT